MVVLGKYFFQKRYLRTTCLNEDIKNLLVWKTIITSTNHSIRKILVRKKVSENCLFKWRYLKITCLSITVFGEYSLEWRYIETIFSNDGCIWKLLLPMKLLVAMRLFRNYLFETWHLETFSLKQHLKIVSSNEDIWKVPLWKTVFGNYLFEKWYWETSSLKGCI